MLSPGTRSRERMPPVTLSIVLAPISAAKLPPPNSGYPKISSSSSDVRVPGGASGMGERSWLMGWGRVVRPRRRVNLRRPGQGLHHPAPGGRCSGDRGHHRCCRRHRSETPPQCRDPARAVFLVHHPFPARSDPRHGCRKHQPILRDEHAAAQRSALYSAIGSPNSSTSTTCATMSTVA